MWKLLNDLHVNHVNHVPCKRLFKVTNKKWSDKKQRSYFVKYALSPCKLLEEKGKCHLVSWGKKKD